jgi:hypothetical protein
LSFFGSIAVFISINFSIVEDGMNTKKCLMLIFLLLTGGLTGLVSCGGGGGGGGGVSAPNYTGITTQAQINQGNAGIISIGAWLGGAPGVDINVFGSIQAVPAPPINPFPLDKTLSIFENFTRQINISLLAEPVYLGAVEQVNLDPIYGNCGGVVTGSGTVDDSTGAADLNVSFQNYCEDGGTINGPANLSGTIDLNILEPVQFTLSFNSLTFVATDQSITVKGTIGVDYNLTTTSLMTMSYIMKDNLLDKAYWYRDVLVEFNSGFGLTQIISINGQYYDPDYGYVEMSLGDEIGWADTDDWPFGGSLILTGIMGTKARLTFLDISTYQVDADTDGDGLYDDYSSGNLLWADY